MNRESRIANPPRASDSSRSIYADVAGGITTFFTMAWSTFQMYSGPFRWNGPDIAVGGLM